MPSEQSQIDADPKSVEHTLCAVHFTGQIGFRDFRTRLPHYPVLSADPLVIEPERGAWACITKFGSVVMWNFTDTLEQTLVSEIRTLPGTGTPRDEVEDELTVRVGGEAAIATFHEITLPMLTTEEIKIISLAMAQSVALDHFELEVNSAMTRSEPVVNALRERGRSILSERNILRTVGFTLSVRAGVLANLTLFDPPPETWESESLSRLDSLMTDHFDIPERHEAINKKVDYLSDLNATLMDLLQNAKGHRIEWMIFLLILVEFVTFLLFEVWR